MTGVYSRNLVPHSRLWGTDRLQCGNIKLHVHVQKLEKGQAFWVDVLLSYTGVYCGTKYAMLCQKFTRGVKDLEAQVSQLGMSALVVSGHMIVWSVFHLQCRCDSQ